MMLLLASVSFALLISAICSLMEATLLSLTPTQVAEIATRRPQLGRIWKDLKEPIDRPISVILIINTTAHTIGATVAGAEFDKLYGDRWIWLFSLVFTGLMLQFTEILPKTLGVRYGRQIALWIGRPLRTLVAAFHPAIQMVRWINRPFERSAANGSDSTTLQEIVALAGLARVSRQITTHQERIIKGTSRLTHATVRQVMIPIEQASILSLSQTLADALVAAHMDAHTRYPVCEKEGTTGVVGYVNFKEIVYALRTNPQQATLRGIMRPVRFVGPHESAADLLKAFVDEHAHMAIVRDDSQRALGLVTLEDVVEELVGELEDEFDRLPRMLHALAGRLWMVGGGTRVCEVNRKLGLSLPEPDQTVSRWLSSRLSSPPRPGQIHREQGWTFNVRRVRRGRVFEVSLLPDAAHAGN